MPLKFFRFTTALMWKGVRCIRFDLPLKLANILSKEQKIVTIQCATRPCLLEVASQAASSLVKRPLTSHGTSLNGLFNYADKL